MIVKFELHNERYADIKAPSHADCLSSEVVSDQCAWNDILIRGERVMCPQYLESERLWVHISTIGRILVLPPHQVL